MTTGSEDANISSGFRLGRGFSIEFLENKGVVAEAASLSFS
jgi:ribosomal protein L13E